MNLLDNLPPQSSGSSFPTNVTGEAKDGTAEVNYAEIGPEIRTNEKGERHYYHKITNTFTHKAFGEDYITAECEYIAQRDPLKEVKYRGWLFGLNIDHLTINITFSGKLLDVAFDFPFKASGSNTSTVRLFENIPIVSEELVKPIKELYPSFTKAIENSFKAVEESIRAQNPDLRPREEKKPTEEKNEVAPNIEVKKEANDSSIKKEAPPVKEEVSELKNLLGDYQDLLK